MATYEPIATTTLGTSASSITFSSIPATYTDLRLIVVGQAAADSSLRLRFNSDTGNNYSSTVIYSFSSAVYSGRDTNTNRIDISYTGFDNAVKLCEVDIFSYVGSTNKTILSAFSGDENGAGENGRLVGLWRNTAAITTIDLLVSGTTLNAGTTATLYGILKA